MDSNRTRPRPRPRPDEKIKNNTDSTEAYDIEETLATIWKYFPSNCTIAFLVLLLNVLVFCFYFKKYRKFVPCMYMTNAFFDSLVAIFEIVAGIANFTLMKRTNAYFVERKWRLVIPVILTRCSIRMSIFVTTLLSVARTIITVRPFHRIKMKPALFSIFISTAFWITLAVLDILTIEDVTRNHESRYGNYIEKAQIGETALRIYLPSEHAKQNVPFVIGFLVPFVIPAVICLVSAIIMILQLRKVAPSEESAKVQKHVSQNILMITVCFVTLHTISTVYYIIHKIQVSMSTTVSIGANRYLFYSTLPLINAFLNPIILISRSKELRGKIAALFRIPGVQRPNETEMQTISND